MTSTQASLLPAAAMSVFDRWQERVRSSPVLQRRFAVWAPVVVTLLAAVLRLWNLGSPHEIVFDETYYVKDAWSQWNLGYPGTWPSDADKVFAAGGVPAFKTLGSFVVQPPLGKWIIGVGMWLFGPSSSFGWRIGTAVCGTATVLVVYAIARALTRSTVFATVAGLLMAISGLGIVLSRVSILDGILTLFLTLAVLFIIYDRRRHLARLEGALALRAAGGPPEWGPVLWGRPWLVAAGAAAGAATAVKWSGLWVLAALGIYAVVTDALARRRLGVVMWPSAAVVQGFASFLLLVPVALAVYTASWAGWLVTAGGYDRHAAAASPATGLFAFVPKSLQSLWIYHQAIYQFNVNLSVPHPYMSPAWEWPLLIRPTSMFWHQDPYGTNGCHWRTSCVQSISSIPNPIIWWGGIAATVWLVVAFVLRHDWRHAVVLTAVASTYLPWLAFPDRTIFQYYTVAIAPFTILALTFALQEIAGHRHRDPVRRMAGQRTVLVFLAVVVVLSAFWYPVWVGMRVPYWFWYIHNWMPTWI